MPSLWQDVTPLSFLSALRYWYNQYFIYGFSSVRRCTCFWCFFTFAKSPLPRNGWLVNLYSTGDVTRNAKLFTLVSNTQGSPLLDKSFRAYKQTRITVMTRDNDSPALLLRKTVDFKVLWPRARPKDMTAHLATEDVVRHSSYINKFDKKAKG